MSIQTYIAYGLHLFLQSCFFFLKKTDQTVPTKADISLPLKFYSSAFFFFVTLRKCSFCVVKAAQNLYCSHL